MALNGLPGKGPWRILEECPAKFHNTTSAARDFSHGRPRTRCVCPRAAALHKAWRDALSARSAAQKGSRVRGISLPRVTPERTLGRVPDLSAGLCRSESGRKIMEGGLVEQLTLGAERRRVLAKQLCERCPLLAECRAWVLRDERPVGSWGGVYGGLDPWNRTGKALIFVKGKPALEDFELTS